MNCRNLDFASAWLASPTCFERRRLSSRRGSGDIGWVGFEGKLCLGRILWSIIAIKLNIFIFLMMKTVSSCLKTCVKLIGCGARLENILLVKLVLGAGLLSFKVVCILETPKNTRCRCRWFCSGSHLYFTLAPHMVRYWVQMGCGSVKESRVPPF